MSRKVLRSPKGWLPTLHRPNPHMMTMANRLRSTEGRRQTTRHPHPHMLTIPSRLRNMEGWLPTARQPLQMIPVEFLGAVRAPIVVLSRHGE